MVKLKDRRSNRQVLRSSRITQRNMLKCACLDSVETWMCTPWSEGSLIRPGDAWNASGWDLPFDNARIWPLDFNLFPVVNNPSMCNITTVPFGFYRAYTRVFLNLKYQLYGYDPDDGTTWIRTQDQPLRGKFYAYILTVRKKYAWALSSCVYNTSYTGTENNTNYGYFRPEVFLAQMCANEQVRNLYSPGSSAPYSCTLTGESSEYAWNQNFKPKWLGKYFVLRKKYCVNLNYRKPDIRIKILFNFKRHGCAYKNITLTQGMNNYSSFSVTTSLSSAMTYYWTYDMHVEKVPMLLMFTSGIQTRQTPYNAGGWTNAFAQREQVYCRFQMQHFFMIPPNQFVQAYNTSSSLINNLIDIAAFENNGVIFFDYGYNRPSSAVSSTESGTSFTQVTCPVIYFSPYMVNAPVWATGRAFQNIMSFVSTNVNEDNLVTDDTVTNDATITYSASREVASADSGGFDSVDGVDDGESEQTTKSLVERFLKKVKV